MYAFNGQTLWYERGINQQSLERFCGRFIFARMPYFEMESTQPLPRQNLIEIHFVGTAVQYTQVTAHKAVMELLAKGTPEHTLTLYKQKISVKKGKLNGAKYQLSPMTFADYDDAVRRSEAAPPLAASSTTRTSERSRSPHLVMAAALARRTPLETVREQLDTMAQGELHQVMALCAARLFTTNLTPQTVLLKCKAELQSEVLQTPWRKWAEVMAPHIAQARADPNFDVEATCRLTHQPPILCRTSDSSEERLVGPSQKSVPGSFSEAVDFLVNWPPHEGTTGSFTRTRCCEFDPRIKALYWRKEGPLCHYGSLERTLSRDGKYLSGPFKVPPEAHEVFYAVVRFVDCNEELSEAVTIRYKHFAENKNWIRDFPLPDLKVWANDVDRFNHMGKLCDFGRVRGTPHCAFNAAPYAARDGPIALMDVSPHGSPCGSPCHSEDDMPKSVEQFLFENQ
mgnify:CR=1 FL=1